MTAIGLALQGGGALGAYEYGAVTRLVEAGYRPQVVTGVSIGAINAAAVAGARDGDVAGTLRRLWRAITLEPNPFLPRDHQALLSMFGNPRFWAPRQDWFNALSWTSLCDVSPMQRTLAEVVDFDRLNRVEEVRFAVTATSVTKGESVRFSNLTTTITPDHILASGSPAARLPDDADGRRPLLGRRPVRQHAAAAADRDADAGRGGLDADRPGGPVPLDRRAAPQPGRADFGGPSGLVSFAQMLSDLNAELPADSALRQHEQFHRLMCYRALRNLHVINSPHVPMTGGMDFSAYGVQQRFEAGYAAAGELLAKGPLAPPAPPSAAAAKKRRMMEPA
jgi:NTE family protein